MTDKDSVLEELKRISKILTLAHGKAIEKELSEVATSTERKRMWVLIDGNRMSKDIAQEVGVAIRSVDRFLKIASAAGLAENPRGKPPRRVIEYVPPSWIELLKIEKENEERETK